MNIELTLLKIIENLLIENKKLKGENHDMNKELEEIYS